MDDTPDIPLDNFGAVTEVATPPVVSEAPAEVPSEQTTQPTEATGSEAPKDVQPEAPKDNPIAEEVTSDGRPEKKDRVQGRIDTLTGKLYEKDSYIEELQAQIARNQALGEVPALKPDENGEYNVAAIQANQLQVAQASAKAEVQVLRQQMEREAIANRYDAEGREIETKFKADFEKNPVHLENIQATINETVQANLYNAAALKDISPLKIAERYMKGIEAERRAAQSLTASNVQSLQAEQAILPNGAPTALDPNSDEAIEARVADIKF